MENQTVVTALFLSGLSDLPVMELILFLLFLCVYLMTLVVNLLIFLLILVDSHLHSPMYFFSWKPSRCSSSITTPRMLFDLSTKSRVISIRACVTQVYFFIFGVASEIQLLAIMSYDCYVAICHSLHYMQIMHWKTCVQLTGAVWAAASVYSLIHTLFTLRLTFCASNTVHIFFCELPQLFQISCTDTYINVLSVFVLGGLLGLFSLIMTFFPYVCILLTVLKMQAMTKRLKAFSTCSSHLTVVFIFYGTILFNYFRPTTSYYAADKLVSVFYTMINPLLNPIIYSLRNQELKASLRRIVKL